MAAPTKHVARKLSCFCRPPAFVLNRNVSRFHTSESRDRDSVRIGCASGFWGDTAVAVPQLIHGGQLDFLVFDYLSEITMSLLAAAKRKNADLGFAPDFVLAAIAPYARDIKKKGIRVISNAGGINPRQCAAELAKAAKQSGVTFDIAVITGDDLMIQYKSLSAVGVREMSDGSELPATVNSMNAYLGAGPIARALDLGADVVITGRCVDSAVTLAPLIHRFKWNMGDFDKMAAGSLAGHLIECGAQSTGGIFTDWRDVQGWENIGFPVVECDPSGEFTLSKPAGTGGRVSFGTAAEQLVYEIGDPARYELPDVTCDFTNVRMQEDKEADGGAVRVTGARGTAPSKFYKVSATYGDGYRATAVCPIGGPAAKEKAEKTADAIIKRCRMIYKKLKKSDFAKVHIQVLGSEQSYGPHARIGNDTREAALWLSVQHEDKQALELFARELAPAGTGMAPGLMGIVGGRPKPSPILKLFSFLHDKGQVETQIFMNGELQENYTPDPVSPPSSSTPQTTEPRDIFEDAPLPAGRNSYRLEEMAFVRSGDKGNNVNIGVVARHQAYLPYLKAKLTEESVGDYFAHLFQDGVDRSKCVERFELPGIRALNFVLHNALGGGGVASLRSDPQGKAVGQMFVDFEVKNVPNLKALRT